MPFRIENFHCKAIENVKPGTLLIIDDHPQKRFGITTEIDYGDETGIGVLSFKSSEGVALRPVISIPTVAIQTQFCLRLSEDPEDYYNSYETGPQLGDAVILPDRQAILTRMPRFGAFYINTSTFCARREVVNIFWACRSWRIVASFENEREHTLFDSSVGRAPAVES